MVGLRNPEFTGPLYLSPVSAVFVRKNFPHIIHLVELSNGVPIHVKTSLAEVIVTSFPANHCPGSVMFLIENHEKRILYTGDFRLNQKELNRIRALTEYKSAIDEIYLDSTFLSHNYRNFPLQEQSCEAIASLIKEWTSKGSHKKILLHTSARYGYEWLYIELYKSLKMKIHVKESEYDSYRYIPEMDDVILCHSQGTQIHACNKGIKDCCCNAFSNKDEIRTIRISAMIWQNWERAKGCILQDPSSKQLYRVCYSNHASLNEIREMLMFFKPKEVYLNVLPQSRTACEKMKSILDSIMTECTNSIRTNHPSTVQTASKTETDIQLSFSNISKVGKRRIEMESSQSLKKVKVVIRKPAGKS